MCSCTEENLWFSMSKEKITSTKRRIELLWEHVLFSHVDFSSSVNRDHQRINSFVHHLWLIILHHLTKTKDFFESRWLSNIYLIGSSWSNFNELFDGDDSRSEFDGNSLLNKRRYLASKSRFYYQIPNRQRNSTIHDLTVFLILAAKVFFDASAYWFSKSIFTFNSSYSNEKILLEKTSTTKHYEKIEQTRRFSRAVSSSFFFINRFNQSPLMRQNFNHNKRQILLIYPESSLVSTGFNNSSYSSFHDWISSNNHRNDPQIKLKLLPYVMWSSNQCIW